MYNVYDGHSSPALTREPGWTGELKGQKARFSRPTFPPYRRSSTGMDSGPNIVWIIWPRSSLASLWTFCDASLVFIFDHFWFFDVHCVNCPMDFILHASQVMLSHHSGPTRQICRTPPKLQPKAAKNQWKKSGSGRPRKPPSPSAPSPYGILLHGYLHHQTANQESTWQNYAKLQSRAYWIVHMATTNQDYIHAYTRIWYHVTSISDPVIWSSYGWDGCACKTNRSACRPVDLLS